MWWASFVSVLHDLWLFCSGRPTAQPAVSTGSHIGPSYSREVVTPAIVKKVTLQPGVEYTAANPDTIAIRSRLSAYD